MAQYISVTKNATVHVAVPTSERKEALSTYRAPNGPNPKRLQFTFGCPRPVQESRGSRRAPHDPGYDHGSSCTRPLAGLAKVTPVHVGPAAVRAKENSVHTPFPESDQKCNPFRQETLRSELPPLGFTLGRPRSEIHRLE